MSNKFTLDDLTNPGKTSQGQSWTFITDGVMGGLSEGQANILIEDNIKCYKMYENVVALSYFYCIFFRRGKGE